VNAEPRPLSEVADKLYFRVGEAARIAGVAPHVLRFWESEFKQIRPERTPAGQRLYRKEDLELILRIRNLLYERKFTIEGARRHLRARSRRGPPAPDALIEEIRKELKAIRRLLS
jgi:DNA-binding transcriptional MerR regulator